MKQNNIREVLSHHPIIPVINFNDIDEVIPMIEKLKAKRAKGIDYYKNIISKFKTLQELKSEYPSLLSTL